MVDDLTESLSSIARKLQNLTPEERAELDRYNTTLAMMKFRFSEFEQIIDNVKLKVGIERIRNGN